MICVFLSSKKAPKFIHLPNSNNRAFDNHLVELEGAMVIHVIAICPYDEKRKTQKCRRIEYHGIPKYQRDPMIKCCVFLTPNAKKRMFDVGSKLK